MLGIIKCYWIISKIPVAVVTFVDNELIVLSLLQSAAATK